MKIKLKNIKMPGFNTSLMGVIKGVPCSANNMDNQIIFGYENDKLLMALPWKEITCITPPTLTFGTWEEFGKEIHANFCAYKKIVQEDDKVFIKIIP